MPICDKAAYFSERIGVDIGGTDIKFCVLDDENKILHKETVPTNKESEQALTDQIAIECKKIMQKFSITAVGAAHRECEKLYSGDLKTGSPSDTACFAKCQILSANF